jgi:DNA-binding transcriptional LysR family regulator
MELRHLRYFVAVAEALSFTQAAERLHLAQPSLTRQIKDLEAEIGVRLFERAGKRISLTQEGEAFLLDARRLVAECAQSVLAVQRLSRGEAGQLNIGYVANLYHDLLPATLGAFRQACPRTALNLFDLTPAEQYHRPGRAQDRPGFCLFPRTPNRQRPARGLRGPGRHPGRGGRRESAGPESQNRPQGFGTDVLCRHVRKGLPGLERVADCCVPRSGFHPPNPARGRPGARRD